MTHSTFIETGRDDMAYREGGPNLLLTNAADAEIETRFVHGTTVEGLPFEFTCYYRADEDQPYRIVGNYLASDTLPGEVDHFDVTIAEEMPWVISEADWSVVF